MLLGRHSLMAGLRILIQFLEKKAITPLFWVKVSLFSFASFSFTSFVRGHQERFPRVPLGSLGFLQLNIIDFTNHRPKMAAFSLKTFRLFKTDSEFRILLEFSNPSYLFFRPATMFASLMILTSDFPGRLVNVISPNLLL